MGSKGSTAPLYITQSAFVVSLQPEQVVKYVVCEVQFVHEPEQEHVVFLQEEQAIVLIYLVYCLLVCYLLFVSLLKS
jgi:hypothetical protein